MTPNSQQITSTAARNAATFTKRNASIGRSEKVVFELRCDRFVREQQEYCQHQGEQSERNQELMLLKFAHETMHPPTIAYTGSGRSRKGAARCALPHPLGQVRTRN